MRHNAFAVIAFWLWCSFGIANAQPVEGQDFIGLDAPARTSRDIEVIEFFFYGCRSCYLLEPVLQDWVQRNAHTIRFRRVPVTLRRAWQPLANLFHALRTMGLLPRLHQEVYAAIHEGNSRLSSYSEQIEWASMRGVDAQKFETVLRSDAVAIAGQRSLDETIAYSIAVTPSIVIDDRYLTTGEMIRRGSRVAFVLDYLLAKALEMRSGK